MFYQILIRTAESINTIPYQYYRTLASAKEALMDWARGVLALHPDKKYSEIPADARSTEKVLLHALIAATGGKPAFEGFIVEHEFADEDGAGFNVRMDRLCNEAADTAGNALAPGEAVEIPYDEYNEDGNNVSVRFEGRHGTVRADVRAVKKDNDGKVTVMAVSENGNTEILSRYDILPEDWPFLTDVILDIKEKQKPQKT